MATLVLTDAVIFADGVDLTGYSNELSLAATAEAKVCSVFGSQWRQRLGGVKSGMVSHRGFVDYATPDSELFAALGTATLVTVAPTSTDGEVAYALAARSTSYETGGTYGEIAALSGQVESDGPIGRGQLLLPKGSVTGAANGTGQQMGAVASGETMRLYVHCFTAGTTADIILESDDNGSFSSATTRASVTVTAAGAEVDTAAGAISDDYWRIRTASVTGTFSIAACAVVT